MARPASPAPSLSCPHCLIPLHSSNAPEPPDIPNDLLATNRPPLDPEIPCIQRVIAAKQARKMRLDAQIAAVEKSLKKLIEDRCVLEEEIKKHEGTLSPLRRMPPELLSLVFIFARPSDRDPAPWIFSQVCRYWRATAIFQPTFWASVVLDFGWESYRTTTEFRLETHLQRSGNLPLNISFKCRFSDECTEQELGVMKVIANHCARWEKILISAPPSLFSDLACVRGHLPILRSLNLSHSFGVRADEEDSTDVFELAPSLQDAFVNMGRGAVTVMLPFSQLHRYYARGTWDSDLNALRSTSNLVECALHIDDISTPPSTAIALPHLLKLSLSHSELLECLDTPNLQELYCSSQSNHLSSLFARRPYQLRKLVLFYPASITDFAGVLRAVPTITDIGLSIEANSCDALSSLLTIRNEPTDVGLSLRSITIGFQTAGFQLFGFGNQDLLVDMVESRWRGGRLRSITVPDVGHGVHRNERLELFKTQGLGIEVASQFGPKSASHLDMVPPYLRLNIHGL